MSQLDPTTQSYVTPWPEGFFTGAQDIPPPYAGNMGDATPSILPRPVTLSTMGTWGAWWGSLPKRIRIVAILAVVLVGFWLLGKMHPTVRNAHKVVAPSVASAGVVTAAGGAL